MRIQIAPRSAHLLATDTPQHIWPRRAWMACLVVALWCLPMLAIATSDAGTPASGPPAPAAGSPAAGSPAAPKRAVPKTTPRAQPTPSGERTKPKTRKVPKGRLLSPAKRKPGVWRTIKDGMGRMVPTPVRRTWEGTKQKLREAQAMYEAFKKFAGWDEKTLKIKRIAAAKQARRERWVQADAAAEKRVIRGVRVRLWSHACHAGSSRACKKWQKVAPRDSRPMRRLRDILQRRKQWLKLLPLCERLRAHEPKAYRHQLCIARALQGLKQTDKALVQYQRLTQLFPLRGMPWLVLGQLQSKAKRAADAAKACAKAVERMPRDVVALHCLATAQVQLKQKKAARATFAKACALDHIPSCQQVRALRPSGIRGAWTWSKMNTRINALRVGRATQLNSCRVGIDRACRGLAGDYRTRAKQLLLYQRPVEAEWWLREATRMAPKDAPSWRALGRLLQGLKRVHEACAAVERSLGLEPRQPKLWLQLGQCRQRTAQSSLAEAKRAFRKACALGHNRACLQVKFDSAPPPKR